MIDRGTPWRTILADLGFDVATGLLAVAGIVTIAIAANAAAAIL